MILRPFFSVSLRISSGVATETGASPAGTPGRMNSNVGRRRCPKTASMPSTVNTTTAALSFWPVL